MAFTVSLPFDQRLAHDDIVGSRAHVRGLHRAGVLTDAELESVLAALDAVESELCNDTFVFAPSDEDIHTAVERRVTEIAGERGREAAHRPQPERPGGHGPSPVLQARAGRPGRAGARAAGSRCSSGPMAAGDAYLPGYTHLQRAQPVLLAHHLLAHGWALMRDVDRLGDALHRVDVSPLGAGALAGSSLAARSRSRWPTISDSLRCSRTRSTP